jgi:hypothetical protein
MKLLFLMADGFCLGDGVSQSHAYAAALRAGHEVCVSRAAGPCALVEPLLERIGVRMVPAATAEAFDLVLSGRITQEQFRARSERVAARRRVAPLPRQLRGSLRHADLGVDALRRAGLFPPVPEAPLAPLLPPRRREYLLIAPGTSPGRRAARWDRWPEFIRACGAPVVLCGDAGAREAWQAEMPSFVLDLIGRTPEMEDLLGVLAGASLVLSPDTGVAHLAAACSVPTVTLFRSGQSRPENGMPYGSRAWGVIEPAVPEVLEVCARMTAHDGTAAG